MTTRYKPPMTLRQSQQLLAGAKNWERQVDGWRAFGGVVVALLVFAYLFAIFIQWLAI